MKRGDIVFLKSGSPALTVSREPDPADADAMVEVSWFGGVNTQRHAFPAACLVDKDPAAPEAPPAPPAPAQP